MFQLYFYHLIIHYYSNIFCATILKIKFKCFWKTWFLILSNKLSALEMLRSRYTALTFTFGKHPFYGVLNFSLQTSSNNSKYRKLYQVVWNMSSVNTRYVYCTGNRIIALKHMLQNKNIYSSDYLGSDILISTYQIYDFVVFPCNPVLNSWINLDRVLPNIKPL